MAQKVRVLHYMNQFFGGIGAEDKADAPPRHRAGPVGPGIALTKLLGDQVEIVGTLICGDNYFVEREEQAVSELMAFAKAYDADVLVAGPAFSSGRHGTACGRVATAWQATGKPAVTGMNVNNPGVELFRENVYIVQTGENAMSMNQALTRMGALAIKLGRGLPIGPAVEEDYFPRGVRRNVRLDRGASERSVEMLLTKLAGRPYRTEVPIDAPRPVPPTPPVKDLSGALVAVVTESGLVPFGNPDRLETYCASKWLKYPIANVERLERGKWEAWHGGYDNARNNEDPHRALPLDALRRLEREGVIGRLHDYYYVTTGNMGKIKTMARLGAEIAQELKRAGVEAVVLTAT